MSRSDNIIYVGMDVHKSSINVAVFASTGDKPVEEWQLANEPRAVKKLIKKLLGMANGGTVKVAYEAGPCGYPLQRQMCEEGIDCIVVAPSMIPSKPGERVKTDRRDARKLAMLLRAELLTAVNPPDPADEGGKRGKRGGKREGKEGRSQYSQFNHQEESLVHPIVDLVA